MGKWNRTVREQNVATLKRLGFSVAGSLPTKREGHALRPAAQIAARFVALRELFMWVSSPRPMRRTKIERALTKSERKIHALPRKVASTYIDTIGWRLENIWPLAWIVGFEQTPGVTGEMIDVATIRRLIDFEPNKKAREADAVLALEDLFYCAHNAARSVQLGSKRAPAGFHPIAGTGVIHERRHALTWATSPRVAWDDTDLST